MWDWLKQYFSSACRHPARTEIVRNPTFVMDLGNAASCEATCACLHKSGSVYSRSSVHAPHFPKTNKKQDKGKVNNMVRFRVIKKDQFMLRQHSSRSSNLTKANRFIAFFGLFGNRFAVSSWPSWGAQVPFVSVNAMTMLGKSQCGFHISKKSDTVKSILQANFKAAIHKYQCFAVKHWLWNRSVCCIFFFSIWK